LERRAAGGDLEAEGSLLNARVRSGKLTRDQLELLVHLGYEPAWIALGWRPVKVLSEHAMFAREGQDQTYNVPLAIRPWAKGLRRWRSDVELRAAVAAARYTVKPWLRAYCEAWSGLGEYEPGGAGFASLQTDNVLRMADLVIVASEPKRRAQAMFVCAEVGQHLYRTCVQTSPVGSPVGVEWIPPGYAWLLARTINSVAWLAECLASCLDVLVKTWLPGLPYSTLAVERFLRNAVRDELAPWILGKSDPVLERVQRVQTPSEAEVTQALASKVELAGGGTKQEAAL
jgi:hypothetical protein